jgi:hypothetical protein
MKIMNINNLFDIADAAKMVQAYDIANTIFAVIANEAVDNQAFGSTVTPDTEARQINFQIETEDDDLIEILSDQDGAGYYALPRLTKYGRRLLGGRTEVHVLCIPLPLVSRFYCNMFVRLMHRETNMMGPAILERGEHSRGFWRLNAERTEACRRDLMRRLLDEVSLEEIELARFKILREEPRYQQVTDYDEEPQYLGPATLAKLTANVDDFESYESFEEIDVATGVYA